MVSNKTEEEWVENINPTKKNVQYLSILINLLIEILDAQFHLVN